MAYSLRQTERKNYRELGKVDLPRRTRQKSRDDDLYAIEVIDEDAGRVKVHYVGYEESEDEWLDKDEIVQLPKPVEGALYIDI